MAVIFDRANDALNVNPPLGQERLSVHGSDWLWAVTAVFIVSWLSFLTLSFFARAGERIFHYIFTIALLVGSISYFAMASDLGWFVKVQPNDVSHGLTRQIFWPKYVNWVVSFAAVILALGLPSGISWTTIFYQVALAWTWIISYLVAAFTASNYKWGFYAFGTVAWICLALSTLMEGARSASRVGISRDHFMLMGWVNFLWLLYPIAWGVSDGGNRIGITQSFIFYGILDVLFLPVVSFAVLVLARRWDYSRLNLAFTQYGRVNAPGGTFPEKSTAAAAGPATATPATGPDTAIPATGPATATPATGAVAGEV